MQVIGAQAFTRNACRQWGARIVRKLLILRELHFTLKGVGDTEPASGRQAEGRLSQAEGRFGQRKAVWPEEGG